MDAVKHYEKLHPDCYVFCGGMLEDYFIRLPSRSCQKRNSPLVTGQREKQVNNRFLGDPIGHERSLVGDPSSLKNQAEVARGVLRLQRQRVFEVGGGRVGLDLDLQDFAGERPDRHNHHIRCAAATVHEGK